jgi:prepilin-type processing-associated H-X9-DG protein
VADGATVHLVMPKPALEGFVGRLLAACRLEAGRSASADHLRKIGQAALLYQSAKGTLPQRWSQLTDGGFITDAALFENPALAVHLPMGDYALVPLWKEAAGGNAWTKILAYETWPKDDPPPGLNALFADGHVEYLEQAQFQHLYRQTLETMGR